MRKANKMYKQFKRERQLQRRNTMLARMVQWMRDNGASERSVLKASKGLEEFVRFVSRTDGPPPKTDPENPLPLPDFEEILGFFLSEIDKQDIHWLWEKRIPLGK